jgi:long-chain acyl-CoA synthetase
MTEKNVLDLVRHDFESPRAVHSTYHYPGGSRSYSSEEFYRQVAGLSAAFAKLGVARGDRVMLLTNNRPEWHIVDLAVIGLGAVDVPVYSSLDPPQIAYQVKDSGSTVAVAENADQIAKFLEIKGECPDLKHLIQISGETADGVMSLDEMIESGDSPDALDTFWEKASGIGEDDLLTLIYTSGTTGEPKGVMLTHRNLVQNVLAAAERAPVSSEDLGLEFLPLCHVFERMVGYLWFYRAVTRAYCSVYDVGDLLAGIAPTVFAGVPRFYEKVFDKVMGKVGAAPPIRRALFNWAVGKGKEAYPTRLAGQTPGGFGYKLAEKLVLSKIREALGGRVRFAISGGAPLPFFVNEFFHSVGLWMLEGYGLTETSPVIAVNGAHPKMTRLGTVGQVVHNVEVRLDEDGELLAKGPSIMQGYWNKPDKTAEVFTEDGFFRTGDIAEIDDEGFIKITDRKKDLIVTAGGKNVAPQPIENELKRSPFVDNAVLIGDRRPYIVALLSPNTEELEPWAKSQGIEYSSVAELAQHPKVQQLFAQVVDSTNENLARYEQLKKWTVLPLMLSIEEGHLTPTLKVKRRVVEKSYSSLIDQLYES